MVKKKTFGFILLILVFIGAGAYFFFEESAWSFYPHLLGSKESWDSCVVKLRELEADGWQCETRCSYGTDRYGTERFYLVCYEHVDEEGECTLNIPTDRCSGDDVVSYKKDPNQCELIVSKEYCSDNGMTCRGGECVDRPIDRPEEPVIPPEEDVPEVPEEEPEEEVVDEADEEFIPECIMDTDCLDSEVCAGNMCITPDEDDWFTKWGVPVIIFAVLLGLSLFLMLRK